MGRRKPFIDKRTATTYTLTCEDRPQEQPTQQPDPKREHHHSPAPAGCSLWDGGTSGGGLSEHERQEVLELGLPDDGYNYLQHIRDPARHISVTGDDGDVGDGAPEFDGPKVFLPAPYLEPPPEDLKLFDARGLPLQEAASDQDLVRSFNSVTAYSREIDDQRPPKRANEVEALTEVTRLLEVAEDDGGAEGAGDLLDDFVLTAASRASQATSPPMLGGGTSGGGRPLAAIEEDGDASSSAGASDTSSQDGIPDELHSRLGAHGVGSIASTYWRPERRDRGGLSILDERFERLALEYDSDELGDLDDDESSMGSGEAFDTVLAQQITEHMPAEDVGDEIRQYTTVADSGVPSAADEDASVAVWKAKELLNAGLLTEEGDVVSTHTIDTWAVREWDCESVLSRVTNLDNHPGQLQEPRHAKPRRALTAGRAGLGDSTGAPGYTRADPHSGAPVAAEGGCPNTQRRRDEKPEERKERKAAVKAHRRVARCVKKETREQYKAGAAVSKAARQADGGIRVFPLSS